MNAATALLYETARVLTRYNNSPGELYHLGGNTYAAPPGFELTPEAASALPRGVELLVGPPPDGATPVWREVDWSRRNAAHRTENATRVSLTYEFPYEMRYNVRFASDAEPLWDRDAEKLVTSLRKAPGVRELRLSYSSIEIEDVVYHIFMHDSDVRTLRDAMRYTTTLEGPFAWYSPEEAATAPITYHYALLHTHEEYQEYLKARAETDRLEDARRLAATGGRCVDVFENNGETVQVFEVLGGYMRRRFDAVGREQTLPQDGHTWARRADILSYTRFDYRDWKHVYEAAL